VLYRRLLWPLLQWLPPELAHDLGFSLLRLACALPGVSGLLRERLGPTPAQRPILRTEAFGLTFPTPLGVAAGFDKNAMGYDALGDLGFGFVEVGTITARPQPGNPRPRLFRLPRDRGLLNRLGFNNLGARDAARRLDRPRRTLVGVNVGKTKVVPPDEAIDDYVASVRLLAPHADYLVVNVSSPNTPGLRDLQAVERLRPLLTAVRDALRQSVPGRRVPLLVKVAPDLSDSDVDAVADLALELALDGIVATNTTVRRDQLETDQETVAALGPGGVSGAPVSARALEVLRRLRRRVRDRLVLVAVGGIFTAEDAWERIRAGATLVQTYTGFVYEGPAMASRLARGLAERATAAGYRSVQEAVGADELAGGAAATLSAPRNAPNVP